MCYSGSYRSTLDCEGNGRLKTDGSLPNSHQVHSNFENMRPPLTREQALAIYQAGEEAVISVLLEMNQCIRRLESRVEELEAIVLKQEIRIKELEDQLAKNSRNSSKPPSTDGFHKPAPKSMREKSQRHSGGQPGHLGQTLQMAEVPDHIVIHRVGYCERCGCSLANIPVNGIEKRQVHDLPPVQLLSFPKKIHILNYFANMGLWQGNLKKN